MTARQNFVGLVVSQGKMAKTVKVRVQTKTYESKIHKEILKRKDYLVHDEGNLCKEGDIVRIQQIPKISARKYFAIAEIKVNRGQQFAQYEELARNKVRDEQQEKLQQFIDQKNQFSSVVSQIEDLRKLDQIATRVQTAEDSGARQTLLDEINEIKTKYGIESWPSTTTILPLEINQQEQQLTEMDRRRVHISTILDTLMAEEHKDKRTEILARVSTVPPDQLKKHTMKNLLRKYVMNPNNECPVAF
jgi:small subunit ribosomal protein S17